MAKYKVCPNPACRHLNPPKLLECELCEADLAEVRLSDSETIITEASPEQEQPAAETPAVKDPPSAGIPGPLYNPELPGERFMKRAADARREPAVQQIPFAAGMVRVCEECGTPNPPNGRKCEKCGEDMSDIMPTPGAAEQRKNYLLASLDGVAALPIPEGETILGREAELSGYLGGKMYVGRRQAKICLRDGKLTIENLKATNYTFVNNQSVEGRVVELKEGDEIGLGGNSADGQRQELAAYFRVQLK